jgi:hypothetical protein
MHLKLGILLIVVVLFCGITVSAEEADTTAAAPDPSTSNLAAKTQNPVSSMISLPFKFSFDYGADNGSAIFLNINPVFPATVGPVNLISRILVPIISTPGGVQTASIPNPVTDDTNTGRVVGLGDINYSLFVSPAKSKYVIWGIGPSLTFPMATDEELGSGKWSAGPTAVILGQPKGWTIGTLVRQLWSYAGASGRPDVNQLLLQPFVTFNLPQGWYLITEMVITANWKQEDPGRWTVPVGAGFGKILKIGKQAVNTRVEAYYNVVQPDKAPVWTWSWTFQLLFPK